MAVFDSTGPGTYYCIPGTWCHGIFRLVFHCSCGHSFVIVSSSEPFHLFWLGHRVAVFPSPSWNLTCTSPFCLHDRTPAPRTLRALVNETLDSPPSKVRSRPAPRPIISPTIVYPRERARYSDNLMLLYPLGASERKRVETTLSDDYRAGHATRSNPGRHG